MFRDRLSVPILFSVIATAASAQSQTPSGPVGLLRSGEIGPGLNGTRYGIGVIVTWPRVQEELKLTDAQKKRLKVQQDEVPRLKARLNEEYRKRVEALGDQPDPEALAALNEGRLAAAIDAGGRFDAGLRDILDRRQFTRLGQIKVQVDGPGAFVEPEMQRRLNLSPEQVEAILIAIREGVQGLRAAVAPAHRLLPDPRSSSPQQVLAAKESPRYKEAVKEAQDAAADARGATLRAIYKVLTKGQRERYQKMAGDPYDLKTAREPATKTSEAN